MTYEDVKRIRANPTLTDVDNEELARMIDKAIEKQIEIDQVIKSLRQCAEQVYLTFCDNDKQIAYDTISYFYIKANALMDVSANRENCIEDVCFLNVLWEKMRDIARGDEQ